MESVIWMDGCNGESAYPSRKYCTSRYVLCGITDDKKNDQAKPFVGDAAYALKIFKSAVAATS